MKLSNVKEPKTTIMAIFGAVITVAGIIFPEKVDINNVQFIESSIDEIITGVGALIAVVGALLAKDK